jgi:3-hydroxyisobutyrate dehydrogenase
MKPSICFIGLGMMGYPMASLLSKAGYPLMASDADAARAARFCSEHEARAVVLPGDAGLLESADVVITMLPDSDIVERVLDGVIAHLAPGATVIDMSSSEPVRSRALAGRLAAAGMRFLDAPVSGGMKRAVDGSLAIMAGGDKATYDEHLDLLRHMGKTLFHVGGPGAGHAMKALNNYVSAAGLVAAVEALHVGRRFGLDPAVMTDVLNASTGRNNSTENKVRQFMLNGRFDSAFSLQLMGKDLGIAMQLGREVGFPMALGDECLDVWKTAIRTAGGPADHTEMYRLLDAPPR